MITAREAAGDAAEGDTAALGAWRLRLERARTPLAYAAFLVSLSLALLVDVPTARPAAVTLPVATAALGWLLLRTLLDRPPTGRHPAWYAAAHFAVLLALIVVLVLCNPYFGFFGYAGYLHALRYLHGSGRAFGVAAAAVPIALSQTGGVLPSDGARLGTFLTVLAFNLLVAGVIVTLNEVTERLSLRRAEANAELAEANARLTETLAENAGLHAQLLAQAREAGIVEERQRLAREIHDTVAQGLAGIVTQLQAADQAREQATPEEVRQRHVDNAARLARESLTQARRAVRALRPEELEHAELPDVLGELVIRWRADQQPEISLTVTGAPRPLHPEAEVTLLRAAQESLANVARHASAGRVGLTLSYMPDVVTLDVRDDGVGFDPATGRTGGDGGYGLTAMRQRAQRLGGTMELETGTGDGTTVSVTVPAIGREA
jgi:signal transduction histidine kinase